MCASAWRINPVSILAAAIALISLFLPWWGIYELGGFGFLPLARWALWSPPGPAPLRRIGTAHSISASSISQTLGVSSLIVLILALVVAALALAGGLTLVRKYLVSTLALSAATVVSYIVAIAYVTYNYCLTAACISGPVGTESFFGTTFTWGFEAGFYLFLVAIVVLALAILLNSSLARAGPIAREEVSVPASQSIS